MADIFNPIVLDVGNPKEAVIDFLKEVPVYFDKNQLFWLWDANTTSWKMSDETEIIMNMDKRMVLFDSHNNEKDITNLSVKRSIFERLKVEGRNLAPEPLSKRHIQFGTRIFNVKTGEIIASSPQYFSTNAIPFDFGDSEETPTIDKLFEEWVGPEEKIKLYELFAFSCLSDYPFQIIFVLLGAGNNGKTTCLNLLSRFLGEDNVATVRLDSLTSNGSRFESSSFYRKLLCQMGETNTGVLKNTQYLKELSGGGIVTVEFKGKNPFPYKNYAKIVIASNSLPPTTDVTTGMLRRWLIIDFPNNFEGREKRDVIGEIPEQEFRNLASKCARILKELLERGAFTNEGTIEERAKKYQEASNPLKQFIPEYYEATLDDNDYVTFSSFSDKFRHWAKVNKRRILLPSELRKLLDSEGYEVERVHTDIINDGKEYRTTVRVVKGLKEKVNF